MRRRSTVSVLANLLVAILVVAALWLLATTRDRAAGAPVLTLMWLFAWAAGVFVTATVAARRGRHPVPWVVLALLLGPLAWLLLAAMPDRAARVSRRARRPASVSSAPGRRGREAERRRRPTRGRARA